MASASGDRREDGDLAALPQGMLASDVILIDRHAHHRKIPQRLSISAAARLQPVQEPGHVSDVRRQIDFLLGAPDARPQPSEIKELHRDRGPLARMAGRMPAVQRRHAITSEKGKKSIIVPAARSLVVSSRTTRPSDCTIEERIPAPSLGDLTAMTAPPLRCRLARRYSRLPGLLR